MSDTNMAELSDRLGSWNWSAVTNLSLNVVDQAPVIVEGVSERISMIRVGAFVNRSSLPFLRRLSLGKG